MLHDLRFALRLLWKQRGTTLAIVLALGFGIGLATAIFNTFSAVMLRPFPHIRDEHRLVYLSSVPLNRPGGYYKLSPPDFLDLHTRSKTLEGLTTAQEKTVIFGPSGAGFPERVLGADVSAEGFAMLGVRPVRGRLFTAADAEPGAAPVALLSYAVWQRRYGGRDDVIGRTELLNGTATTLVGVLPAGFGFPDNSELWMPLRPVYDNAERGSHYLGAWARLRDGVTLDEARAEIAGLAATLAKEYKATNDNKGFALRLVREEATEDTAVLMRLMLGAALFVLLIACANVANLLLARAAGRSHEIAIRLSVGATRGRIVRQVLTESLLLGLLGGGLGLLLAGWANSLLLAAIPKADIPFWLQTGFDWRVFGFAAAAALGSSLLFGSFPAVQASRSASLDLKEGARSVSGSRRARLWRQSLVVAQVALSAVLLIGAGLFVRSFLKLHAQPLGFDPQGVVTFRVGLPAGQFRDPVEVRRFFTTLTARLTEIPGVTAAGGTSLLPGTGNNNNAFVVEGQALPESMASAPFSTDRIVTPGYFAALRIPLLRGRLFGDGDTREAPLVCLVDQQFANRWFNGQDPVGRRIRYGFQATDKPLWMTIVGVVGDVPQRLNSPSDRGSVYRAAGQMDINFLSYAVRVNGDPTTFGPALQRAVLAAHPGIPIYNVMTLQQTQDIAYWQQRFFGQVFSVFGLGALFLASLGVYGVMAYSVTQRTAEIGVRMALGATERDVLRLVGRQGVVLVGAGLGLGVGAAFALTRFMASLLFGVSPSDPPTFALLAAVLALVGLLACWLPARRAAKVDPITALRAE